MAYIVDATNAAAPLASDYSGPYTAEEIRAIKAYYLAQFSNITSQLNALNLAAIGYLKNSGDTSLGQLKVPLTPSTDESATPKKYVDDAISTLLGALSGASLNASKFAGFRLDSSYNLIVDHGAGTWVADDYEAYDFVPNNATFAINNVGEVVITF